MANEPDWKQQAEQFRAELDRVNPLLDAATAKLALCEREKADATAEAERQVRANAALVAERANLTARVEELAPLVGECARLKVLATKQQEGVVKCIRSVGDLLATLNSVVNEG